MHTVGGVLVPPKNSLPAFSLHEILGDKLNECMRPLAMHPFETPAILPSTSLLFHLLTFTLNPLTTPIQSLK